MIINGSFGFLKSDAHHLYCFLKSFPSHNLVEFSTYPEDNIFAEYLNTVVCEEVQHMCG